MEYTRIPDTDLEVSRIGLGTWAMGGWMWGGTDEEQSIKTIHAALEKGINLIDTAATTTAREGQKGSAISVIFSLLTKWFKVNLRSCDC